MAFGELNQCVYTPCPTKAGANPPNSHNAQGPVYMGYTHTGALCLVFSVEQTEQGILQMFSSLSCDERQYERSPTESASNPNQRM